MFPDPLIPGPTPILAQVTMHHVALFYGGYLLVFALFVLGIGLLRSFARRAMLSNNTDAALIWYDRLWFLFGPAVRKEIKPQIQINLAIVHAAQGNRGRAYTLLRDARRAGRKLKTPELLIQACVISSKMQEQDHELDKAYRSLHEARGASEKDSRKPGLVRLTQLMAELQMRRGETQDALNHWHILRRLADARRDVGPAILALTHIGRMAYDDCEWDTAEEHFSSAVQRAREEHCRDRSALLAFVLFGRLTLQRGRYELARGYLVEAAELAKKRGESGLECIANLELGRLQVERGRYKEARELLDRAEQIARQLGDPARIAMVSQVLGDAYLQGDDLRGAHYHYEQAQSALAEYPLTHTDILVRSGLGLIACHTGKQDEAVDALLEAERIALKHRASFELVCVYDALALVMARGHEGDEALKYQTMAHDLRRELGVEAAISDVYRQRRQASA